jgi:DNA polymerase-3 subunit gamma/tau
MAKKGTGNEQADQAASPQSAVDSSMANPGNGSHDTDHGNGKYTVVARRYRPKTFAELVGQSTVAQALLSAIESNRVGHAYLFTGARGVGKTSTARIFAKALNASAEADGKFDPHSETALAIDSGEDMDVLEIDGASNRGIDEIRQLRANAAVRPSRSRYKIYIIDEVHMLTTQAFNALLKTLEEPPGHVKFIFCTTDPEKIPITVLSRCQRFDFPPVHTEQIYERLKFICENEGTKADEGALRLIARRAAGSMRDSQSLLEQLLSFGGTDISADTVHAMLGTADETRLATFASRMIERDAAGALRELDIAAGEGVDVGQLAEQLLGYLRDMMAVSVGGAADLIRTANPSSCEQLQEWGKTWGTMTLLSALQLLDETIVRMRHSVQSRVLLEVALVQICNLQDLQSLSELVKAFAANQAAPPPRIATAIAPPAADPKKKDEPITSSAFSKATLASQPVGVEQAAPPNVAAPTATARSAPNPIVTPLPAPPAQPPIAAAALVATANVVAAPAVTHSAPMAKPEIAANSQAATLSGSGRPNPTLSGSPVPNPQASKPAALPPNASPTRTNSEQVDAPNRAAVDALEIFRETAIKLGGFASQCGLLTVRVEQASEGLWKIFLSRDGAMVQDYFQTGENGRRLLAAIKQRMGRGILLEYIVTKEASPEIAGVEETPVAEAAPQVEAFTPTVPQAQLIRNAMGNPLIKQFMDVFEGQIVRVDPVPIKTLRSHLEIPSATAPMPASSNEPEYETADSEN